MGGSGKRRIRPQPLYCQLLRSSESHTGAFNVSLNTTVLSSMCRAFVTVLAPFKDKSAKCVAHVLVTYLFCLYTALLVLLSDNGTEFRKHLGVKHCFTATYHPARNGLVERANRKILEILRTIVGEFLGTWEHWLTRNAARLNNSVCESAIQSPPSLNFLSQKTTCI